jgi:folate-binding protein YgfZ
MTLNLPGADDGVAWHYGDPLREQRFLDAGEGFIDLSHRPVIRVAGPDRMAWLHTLTSQHLTELEPSRWTQALILDANGRVEHHLTLVDDGSSVWAHVEPGTADALVDYLTRMKFWSDVDVTVSEDRAVVWQAGEGTSHDDGFVLVPRTELQEYAESHGPAAGIWAYEALRVAQGRPRLGFETDHRTIPHEVGWIGPAVHLQKGCYRGQETVARVDNLGKPPRRLVRLHLDGSADQLPVHGSDIVAPEGGRSVGFVGTVAQHYLLGPIALAVVKRSTDPDAVLLADGVPATQDVLVAGRSSSSF